MLDQLLDAARAGESRPLVVRGEAGVGKTALLDYLAEQATGSRVAHASGVESEMELAYAGVHQLLVAKARWLGEGSTVVANAERAKDAAEAYRSGYLLVYDLKEVANRGEGAMA